MASVLTPRRLPALVALIVVLFAFWPALFGGGSLVSADIVATAPPFDAYQPDGFTLENGPGDPINIHSHWGSLAADVRSGDVGWWDRDLAGGQPTMKGGLPVFDLAYLVVPAWFAPGLVAAIRAAVAVGLAAGFLRAVGLGRLGALTGGLAFAFSGFMVGWMNWPHSSVAALAPGLLWAVERLVADPRPWRAAPVAAVAAAMVWSNFPPVTVYVLLGAAVYGGLRVVSEGRDRSRRAGLQPVVLALVAGLLAALLAAPHLVGFSEYLDWADTSHRATGVDDSSAGIAYLMTAAAPAIWGSDAVGPGWFGEGNWVEFNAHVGTSVLLLAALGLAAGVRAPERRRRVAAIALAAIAVLGVLIAYVGGPLGVLLGDLTGPEGGLMTRAKVLWSLGVALGAGFGVDLLADEWGADGRRRFRRALWGGGGVLVLGGLLLVPSILDWFDIAREAGVVRQTLAVSTAPLIAGLAVLAVVVARGRGWVAPAAAGWSLVAIVIYELLLFAMPVPTIVDADERLEATPAHAQVRELLGPGERLAGEGRTFFPATTELFDIDDARGQVLKSPGYQALLRAVDPNMLRTSGGGTPTYPNIAAQTDVTLPVWDAMAVRVWAQFPDSRPPGSVAAPRPTAQADPAEAPLTSSVRVPPGGLRAVVIEAIATQPGFLAVRVTAPGFAHFEERWIEPTGLGEQSYAVAGEDLPVGTEAVVSVTATPPGRIAVGVEGDGALAIGTVAGDDELRLVRAGDVTLLERPGAAFARLVDAVVVESDAVDAAALVRNRTAAGPGAVVASDVGLPATPDPDAELGVVDLRIGRDTVDVEVATDRPALLVLAQVDYPGWSATVDGRAVPIVTTDAAFTGVVVPTGTHSVRLAFRPNRLGGTLALALSGLAALLALLLSARRGGFRSSARPAR